MTIRFYLFLLITISFFSKGYAQKSTIEKESTPITKETNRANLKKFIKNLPSFSIFGDNYLVTGTTTTKNAFTSEGSDTKFEIGFKHLITNADFFGVIPFVTYRQKAFWDTYKESVPFRELNYNPAVGIAKLYFEKENLKSAFYLSFEHESNGRDGENSRSWNVLALTYFKPIGENIQLTAKTWIPIGDLSSNKDILSYRGLFNIGVTYKANEKLYFDIFLQPAYDTCLQGSIKTSISYKVSKNGNQFFYLQYFGGHAEDLIYYNKSVSNLRLGFAVKDLTFNFKQKNKTSF